MATVKVGDIVRSGSAYDEVKRAFANIFPQFQKPKRWRKDFDTKEQVQRAVVKGNPFAKNIANAMGW